MRPTKAMDRKTLKVTKRMEDTAPCGVHIEYTVDTVTDCADQCSIADRGAGRLRPECGKCTWRDICRPAPEDGQYHEFEVSFVLMFSQDEMDTIADSYGRARKQGFTGDIRQYVEHLAQIGICTTLIGTAERA